MKKLKVNYISLFKEILFPPLVIIGILTILANFSRNNKGDIFAIVFISIIVMVVIGNAIFSYINGFYLISYDDKNICLKNIFIKKIQISIHDIQDLKLTTKGTFSELNPLKYEAMSFKYKGKKYFIYNDLYNDYYILKQFLHKAFYEEIKKSKIEQNKQITSLGIWGNIFTIDFLWSVIGICILGFFFTSFLRDIVNCKFYKFQFLLYCVFPFIVYKIFANKIFSIYISNNEILIYHSILFFINKKINAEKIREIVIEPQYRLNPALRIVFKDFKEIKFPMGTFYKKHWKIFANYLKDYSVLIRDEVGVLDSDKEF